MLQAKRIYLILGLALLGIVILLILGAFLSASDSPPASSAEPRPAQSAGQQEPAAFVVGEYGGRLAVYRGDSASPFQVYDVYVSTLPEYDRELLKNGVPARDQAQLDRLIEDYTS